MIRPSADASLTFSALQTDTIFSENLATASFNVSIFAGCEKQSLSLPMKLRNPSWYL